MSNPRPRRGLNPVAHATSLPMVPQTEPAQSEVPSAPVAVTAPPAATTSRAVEPAPEPPAVSGASSSARATRGRVGGDPSGRVRIRQRDEATLIRKGWRIQKHVVEALGEYCQQERWPEGTVVERAIEHYLESLGRPVGGGLAEESDAAE